MRIFGLTIGKPKIDDSAEKALSPVPIGGSWRNGWRVISEPDTGAWQRNMPERQADVLTYPTLYACISRIASDIGKLPFSLRERRTGGTWIETESPAYSPVLRKPNAYQTAAQFREQWMLAKLIHGNAYVLKRRDNRGVVIDLYVLDSERVMPMVSDSGAVYYQLQTDKLNTIPDDYPAQNLIIPASEIIHDRCMTIHHPLIGVPPISAASWPAVKNMKIMRNATEFFGNSSQPGGILTAPAGMSQKDLDAIEAYWNKTFSGQNSGRVGVIGADMKFTGFAMKSVDAQMIEHMRYSDEQICQPFGIPPFKIGIGSIPTAMGVDGINQLYYSDALQTHIEHMELLLDDGLRISPPLGVELDLEPLLRMDEAKRAEVAVKLTGGGIETPNEGRARFNHLPLDGGDTVYMQKQDIPLDQARLNTAVDANVPQLPQPEPESTKSIVVTPGNLANYLAGEEIPMEALKTLERDLTDAFECKMVALLARIDELESRLAAFKQPQDGEKGEKGMQGEKGDPGEKGERGSGISDLLIDRDGVLIATFDDGRTKSLGQIIGKDGRDGIDGKDGVGLDQFGVEYLPETHEVMLTVGSGERAKSVRYPAGGIQPAGYWRDGCKAIAGQAWTCGGSLWIAKHNTTAKPSTQSDDWQLAARAGKDGERGPRGGDPDNKPIKVSP